MGELREGRTGSTLITRSRRADSCISTGVIGAAYRVRTIFGLALRGDDAIRPAGSFRSVRHDCGSVNAGGDLVLGKMYSGCLVRCFLSGSWEKLRGCPVCVVVRVSENGRGEMIYNTLRDKVKGLSSTSKLLPAQLARSIEPVGHSRDSVRVSEGGPP